MSWYENDNSSTASFPSMFSGLQHTIACTASGTRAINIGDIDGDGLPDVFAMIYSGDRLSWYKNTNATNKADLFAVNGEILIDKKLNGIRDAVLVDLDADGLLDIATVRLMMTSTIATWGDVLSSSSVGLLVCLLVCLFCLFVCLFVCLLCVCRFDCLFVGLVILSVLEIRIFLVFVTLCCLGELRQEPHCVLHEHGRWCIHLAHRGVKQRHERPRRSCRGHRRTLVTPADVCPSRGCLAVSCGGASLMSGCVIWLLCGAG